MGKELKDLKISIIVPVYNTQKYLEECMDSILGQDFEDMEVLCIDDGSTDQSGGILDAYARKDGRIHVFHIPNGGYGHAVNYGIDRACGKYISIIEPDDYIESGMMETLFLAAEKNEAEVVSGNYKRFSGSGEGRIFQLNQVMDDARYYHKVLNPDRERDLFKGTYLNQAALFRRDFVDAYGIRHHESPGASYQDVGFRLQTLAFATRFMILEDAFYCHRDDNPNSSINNRTCIHWIIGEYAFVFQKMEQNKHALGSFLPELMGCKVTDYLGQYDRLIPELRPYFLQMVRKEFMESLQKGEFDISKLTERQRKRVQFILDEPDSYAQREIRLRDELHGRLQNIDAFIIYGVGMFGRKIYDVMYEDDKKKMLGFAVSDIRSNRKEYEGVPVKEIGAYDKNIGVIVGVTEKYEEEVISLLESQGIGHILCMESGRWF